MKVIFGKCLVPALVVGRKTFRIKSISTFKSFVFREKLREDTPTRFSLNFTNEEEEGSSFQNRF